MKLKSRTSALSSQPHGRDLCCRCRYPPSDTLRRSNRRRYPARLRGGLSSPLASLSQSPRDSIAQSKMRVEQAECCMHLSAERGIAFPSRRPAGPSVRRLTEEEPVEVRAVNLRMTPSTGALEKCPGCLVMEERGVAMAFQAEHALFPPLQEKLVGRSVRHVTARASLNTTGQMFKGEWTAFLDMAPGAGLVVYTAEEKRLWLPCGVWQSVQRRAPSSTL